MEEGAMAKELLPDAFWARIAPLLPPEPPKPKSGRSRVSDRAALTGILFVLDSRHLRLALRTRRIIPRIARCGVEPKNRLGRYRLVVERTLCWLNRFRRLKIRTEHR